MLCASLLAQPRLQINGLDTSAIIPIQSLKGANMKFIELKQCKEDKDSLYSLNRTYQGVVANQKSTISELKEAIRLDHIVIYDKQEIIDLTDKQIKKSNQKIKLLKIERNSIIGISIGLIIKIFVLK